MKTTKNLRSVAVMITGLMLSLVSWADKSVGDNVKEMKQDVGKHARKSNRKLKKSVRDAKGEKNVLKDAGDSIKNTGDEIKDKAND